MFAWSAVLALGIVSLVPGKQVSYRIASRDVRSFSLNASPHQFINGVVDQGETDLIVTLFAPDGRRVARFDGRGRGIKRVSFLAEYAGTYRLDVQTVATSVRPQPFRIRFDEGRRVQDLYSLHLRADLVVLSSCETGVGKQVGGEGLASVARGFFYAGAARVMATLWRVDDTATATFMALFYSALLRETHPSPAAALRAAQKAMRAQKRWIHPYCWSGFVLQGES
jgi:CHAT domain-containing protein